MVKKNILIIQNPTAGRSGRERLAAVLRCLENGGQKVTVATTKYAGHGRALAAAASGYHVIVAAGGDGTVNEVLNGLTPFAPPLAFLPLGTANVLAREIGQDSAPRAIADTIMNGAAIQVSCGNVQGGGILGSHGAARRFLLMVSVGADALAVAALRPGLKRWIGSAAYLVAGMATARQLSGQRYQVVIDGIEHQCHGAIITKAARYGGAFVIAPGAHLSDPGFEILLPRKAGIPATLKYTSALLAGRLGEHPEIARHRGQEIEIQAEAANPRAQPVQIDGDDAGVTPIRIGVDPLPLKVLVPPAYADQVKDRGSISP